MALEDYGLHELAWNLVDQVVSDIFAASPMDARGRGIALSVRDAGASGTTFTPASPLSLSNGALSIDLSGYATTQYVDNAIAALDDLSEEEF